MMISDIISAEASDVPIDSVDDWHRLVSPKKGRRQWKHSRSAVELTRAWSATGQINPFNADGFRPRVSRMTEMHGFLSTSTDIEFVEFVNS